MSEVTRILDQIQQGDTHAAEQLLPLVYEELRRVAAEKRSRFAECGNSVEESTRLRQATRHRTMQLLTWGWPRES